MNHDQTTVWPQNVRPGAQPAAVFRECGKLKFSGRKRINQRAWELAAMAFERFRDELSRALAEGECSEEQIATWLPADQIAQLEYERRLREALQTQPERR